jgi:nucleoside-diphosphate-sugar epimerase
MPVNPALEWSKLIAERYVEFYAHQNRFRSCTFRLSTVYAPNSPENTPNFVTAYAEALNSGDPLRLPAGGAPKRDLLHVEDFARACEAFVDSVIRHGLYNLGGGRENAVTLRDLITKMEKFPVCKPSSTKKNPRPRDSDELRHRFESSQAGTRLETENFARRGLKSLFI